MKIFTLALCVVCATVLVCSGQEILMDWAYHSIGTNGRLKDCVPGGGSLRFLANGNDRVQASDTVTLYVLTDNNFGGDLEEQVYVRWWDGYMAHWIMGSWVRNVLLSPANTFRDQPTSDEQVVLDLWRVDVPAWVTQRGENYYAIQLKAYDDEHSEERYLLCRGGGDFARTNRMGQVWSSSEEFDGQDWKVGIGQQP